jgi:tetratricopeptide (TPR) repeat protein
MDIDIVKGMIGRGFRLGLYGHQHKAQLAPFQIWLPENEAMALVSAGSLCAGRKDLPKGYNRQYNILEIREDMSSVRVHVRDMSVANLFVKGRFNDLGGVSFVDMKWELPKNKVGRTVDLKKVQIQNKIMEAEHALKNDNSELAIEILSSVELFTNSYQRNIFIEAAEKARKWNTLIARITPTNPVELESIINAYQQLKDFEGALNALQRFSKIVSMPPANENEFKKSIEINKQIYQNV